MPDGQAWLRPEKALLEYRMGSPEQAMLWAQALVPLPEAIRTELPTLRHLKHLAGQAWPCNTD